MKITFAYFCILALMGLVCSESWAFQLTISNRQYPGAGAAMQTQLDQLADNIQNQFNNSIASTGNQSNFLNAVGNANALSSRSFTSPGVITSDDHIVVSAGVTGALAIGDGGSISNGISFPKNSLPPIGVSGKAGLSIGASGNLVRLPFLDPSRMMYSASFYSSDLSHLIGHNITLKTSQMSVGAAYQFYVPQSWTPLVRYNGIRIASSLTYSSFDASYRTPFDLSSTDSSTGATMSWKNDVDLAVNSKVYSLSNEVTTGVRLLWCLNFFTGIGLDFNAGSSSITGGSSGPVTGTVSGSTVFTGTAKLDGISQTASPTFAQVRYLLGTQIDVGAAAIYLQGQFATPSGYALNLGVHAAF